jgi:hypothetical protein
LDNKEAFSGYLKLTGRKYRNPHLTLDLNKNTKKVKKKKKPQKTQ